MNLASKLPEHVVMSDRMIRNSYQNNNYKLIENTGILILCNYLILFRSLFN